jgi:hypothetical protein
MPSVTLESRVTAFVAAMAGASAPVLRADCPSANPTSPAASSAQSSQRPSSASRPLPNKPVNCLVSADAKPKPRPAPAPNSIACTPPRFLAPTEATIPARTPLIRPAVHQSPLLGAVVPGWGDPTVMNRTIPTATASAPSTTVRVMR